MKTYLVGGAVRDSLLNLPVNDRDWLIVGSEPQQMLNAGFIAVGKEFPVFLHPETQEEYALARTEKKTGAGYKGFECYFAKEVTLEEDLQRRDLTINALAQDENGLIIDPYGGLDDLKNRQLRHVSESFIEDPLRVLRVARFAAKLHHLGFHVADETMALMRKLSLSGELAHLTAERIWQEWLKSLATPSPHIFLQVLYDCCALEVVLPELNALFGVPQSAKWHPEIDTGVHTLMVSQQAALISKQSTIRFAAQLHDLGKGVTPKEQWPSHKQHEEKGLPLIQQLCERIKVPNEFRELALAVCAQHGHIHRIAELGSDAILTILDQLDVWRKPQRLNDVLLCCEADHRGRLGFTDHPYPQKALLLQAYQAALQVNVQAVIEDGFKARAIKEELNKRRILAIEQACNV